MSFLNFFVSRSTYSPYDPKDINCDTELFLVKFTRLDFTMRVTTAFPRISNSTCRSNLNYPAIRIRPNQRPFVSSSTFRPLQNLTASRILPYPSAALYELITDISAYPTFLPYCTSSTITSLSSPDPKHHKRWPRTAVLRVGWRDFNESFESRIYCLPHHTLEACAGSAAPTIPRSDLPHYYEDSSPHQQQEPDSSKDGELFTSLLTRWTLHEFPFKPSPPAETGPPQVGDAEANPSHPRTEVRLVIEAQFANAMYSALGQAAAPKVAGMMISAFEKRAQEVLGEGHGVREKGASGGGGENRGRKTSTEGVVGEEGVSTNKHH
ncbi:MAG: hypothetical protein Q9202_003794 [Teloschistes flavicans]